MKPQMVMLEVRPLDARKLPVTDEPYKFPYIEMENLVFLRVNDDKMKAWKVSGEIQEVTETIMQAAAGSGTSWVTVPDTVGMLDQIMQEVQETDPEDLNQSEVMMKLSVMKEEILKNNQPTNKTFIILPESVRFLEVREKWETIKEEAPQRPERKKKHE